MKPIPKWLMIPPAVALLLVLGPLAMQGGAASADTKRMALDARTPAGPATTVLQDPQAEGSITG